MILGQYIQGNLWCVVAWTWPVLPCPCDADAAAPTLPSTRARTRIPRFTQVRTVPVAGAWGALPTDPLVRMMTCKNDLRLFIWENPLIGDFPLQEEEVTPEPISGYGIRIDPGDKLPTWLGRLVVAVPCQPDTACWAGSRRKRSPEDAPADGPLRAGGKARCKVPQTESGATRPSRKGSSAAEQPSLPRAPCSASSNRMARQARKPPAPCAPFLTGVFPDLFNNGTAH